MDAGQELLGKTRSRCLLERRMSPLEELMLHQGLGAKSRNPFSFVLRAVVRLFQMFAETRAEPNGKSARLEQGGFDVCAVASALAEPFCTEWLVLVGVKTFVLCHQPRQCLN